MDIIKIGLVKIFLFGSALISSLLGISDPSLSASFNPAGGLTYRLQTSAGSTDTTIRLSSLKNRSDIPLTMTILNTDIGYGTLSPQTNRSEFISFTGITQNANGTASLTGVTRGLSDIYPFTASTTLRESHPGQSVFILSDSPQLFEEYAKTRSDMTITGAWTFSTAASSTDECSASVEYCTKNYIDNVTNQGAATSTESNGGIVELATRTEAASTTASTAAKPLVLQAQHASSTPGANITATGGSGETYLVMSEDDGKLNQGWLDLSESFTFSATTTTKGLTASSTTDAPITLNGISYNLPSTQGASSTVLTNDGTGKLISTLKSGLIYSSTTPPVIVNSVSSTTIAQATIPANSLGTQNLIEFNIPFTYVNGASGLNDLQIDAGLGTASSTITFLQAGKQIPISTTTVGFINVKIAEKDIVNSQKMTLSIFHQVQGGLQSLGAMNITNFTQTSTSALSFTLIVAGRVSDATITFGQVIGKLDVANF